MLPFESQASTVSDLRDCAMRRRKRWKRPPQWLPSPSASLLLLALRSEIPPLSPTGLLTTMYLSRKLLSAGTRRAAADADKQTDALARRLCAACQTPPTAAGVAASAPWPQEGLEPVVLAHGAEESTRSPFGGVAAFGHFVLAVGHSTSRSKFSR